MDSFKVLSKVTSLQLAAAGLDVQVAKVADAVFHLGGSDKFFGFLELAFAEQAKLSDAALVDWVSRVGLSPTLVMQRAELPAGSGGHAALVRCPIWRG